MPDEDILQPDRSEQDIEVIESGGEIYIREDRYSNQFIQVPLPKEKGFREGTLEEDVKKIFGD